MCSCEPVVAGASPLCPRLNPTTLPPSPAPTLTACAHRRLRPQRRPCPPSPIIACAAVAWTAVFCARTFRARLFSHSSVPASLVVTAEVPPAAASGWRSWALDSARFSCPRLGSTFGRGGSGLAPAPPTSFCSPLAPSYCGSGWRRPRLRLPPVGLWRSLGYRRQLASVRAFFLRLGALRGRRLATPRRPLGLPTPAGRVVAGSGCRRQARPAAAAGCDRAPGAAGCLQKGGCRCLLRPP